MSGIPKEDRLAALSLLEVDFSKGYLTRKEKAIVTARKILRGEPIPDYWFRFESVRSSLYDVGITMEDLQPYQKAFEGQQAQMGKNMAHGGFIK